MTEELIDRELYFKALTASTRAHSLFGDYPKLIRNYVLETVGNEYEGNPAVERAVKRGRELGGLELPPMTDPKESRIAIRLLALLRDIDPDGEVL
jgi:hypothetical protein